MAPPNCSSVSWSAVSPVPLPEKQLWVSERKLPQSHQAAELLQHCRASRAPEDRYWVWSDVWHQTVESKGFGFLFMPVWCLLSPSGECVRCMFWNNLGCIHFAMGKHNLGIFYFKKALQENDHTCAQLGDGSNGQSEWHGHLERPTSSMLDCEKEEWLNVFLFIDDSVILY